MELFEFLCYASVQVDRGIFGEVCLHYVCLNVWVLLLHFRFAALQPLQRARHQYDVEANVRQLVTELKSDACSCARHNSPSAWTVALEQVESLSEVILAHEHGKTKENRNELNQPDGDEKIKARNIEKELHI